VWAGLTEEVRPGPRRVVGVQEIGSSDLITSAHRALAVNRRHGLTVPHLQMFPAGYLWDTAVIVKGLAVFDPARAAAEILRLLGAQWRSGMLPNEVYFDTDRFRRWIHGAHPDTPTGMTTSGITQPLMIVRSALEVGRRLGRDARLSFYRAALPALSALCRWVVDQRIGDRGLAVVIHPHETGMDNRADLVGPMAAHWLSETSRRQQVTRAALLLTVKVGRHLVGDCRTVSVGQRSSHLEVLAASLQTHHLRRLDYDLAAIRASGRGVLVEDVGFNAVFLDAVHCLQELAAELGPDATREHLPPDLPAVVDRLTVGLERLWQPDIDVHGGGYVSRDARTGQVLPGATVAGLFPLLVERRPERVRTMTGRLADPGKYWTLVPPPSAPVDSPTFDPVRYWQGPAWPFPTDILETGLELVGQHELADELRHRYLTRPHGQEHAEYQNPLTGAPLGARPFSPAAALTLRFADRLPG
jgi:hypothetical protein